MWRVGELCGVLPRILMEILCASIGHIENRQGHSGTRVIKFRVWRRTLDRTLGPWVWQDSWGSLNTWLLSITSHSSGYVGALQLASGSLDVGRYIISPHTPLYSLLGRHVTRGVATRWKLPVPQITTAKTVIKSCLILAGLWREGETSFYCVGTLRVIIASVWPTSSILTKGDLVFQQSEETLPSGMETQDIPVCFGNNLRLLKFLVSYNLSECQCRGILVPF